MPEPYIDRGFRDAGGPCINCDQPIDRQVYLFWEDRGAHLCSNCLMQLFESVFGRVRPTDQESEAYKKKSIPNAIKWEVWQRDDFTCQYCGDRSDLAVDHIVPESRGGDMALTNLVTACKPCNSKKGARTPEGADMPLLNDPRQ